MMNFTTLELFEFLSYVATVVGIPLALMTFVYQERKERQNEQEEIYDKLMAHYADIQEKLFLYPELDLHLEQSPDPETQRRQYILYEMLISLFERSFILLESEKSASYQRMWNSWVDYIETWLKKPNFVRALPLLVKGEDPDFVAYIAKLSGLALKP
jgi:Zn-dependent oligopeptidase